MKPTQTIGFMRGAKIAFGRALGRRHGRTMDVHGAGAQRSEPKTGNARIGRGPQGDAQRVKNHVRCVRGGATAGKAVRETDEDRYPNKIKPVKVEHRSGLASRPGKRGFSTPGP